MSGDRGRIPFALIGVLLLVSSATIATTSQPGVAPSEPTVSKELDRATAESQTAIREGAMAASRDAAQNPVVKPANTPAGDAINESSAFRESLRIQIYLAVREHLEKIDRQRGDVTVTASLPPVNDTAQLQQAKERVHIERADENGTSMRVHVENVTVTATRDGRHLTDREVSPTVVVGTPVLGMHDRVDEYQRQLDAGVHEPGLNQRLTAQLYPLVWGRGYAQYSGAPIENVVSNQHVAVATNGGLLDIQRATFGQSDPDGLHAHRTATAKALGSEVITLSDRDAPLVEDALDSPTAPPPNEIGGLDPPEGPRSDDDMTVAVNETADDGFLDLVQDDGLNDTVTSVYSADVRYVTDVERSGDGLAPPPASPGREWTLVSQDRDSDHRTTSGGVDSPATPPGWQEFASYSRKVEVTNTRTKTWEKGNETRITSTEATMTRKIAVSVVGRPATTDQMPPGEIETAYDRGEGPFDGPNLADVPDRAIEQLVTERGGPNAVLDRAGSNSLDTSTTTIRASQPEEIEEWAYRDLMDLREDVRAIEVSNEGGQVGTFEANPQAQLADELRDERAALIGAPPSYGSTAAKARYTARAAYLDAVISRLDERAANRAAQEDGFGDTLEERGAGSLDDVQAGAKASRDEPPAREPGLDGHAGDVGLRVDSAPSYLTHGEVRQDRVPAVDGREYPLAVRNVNVFTLPYGDAVDAVFGYFGGSNSGHVRLSTAAQTLRAANSTLGEERDGHLRHHRTELLWEVQQSERFVRAEMRDELRVHGIGDSSKERWDIVTAGMNQWDSWDARALAISNGSASAAVAAEAEDHSGLETTERDRLELELENTTQHALTEEAAQPDLETVNESRKVTEEIARELTKDLAKNSTEMAVEGATDGSVDRVPAGLPLAPPISAWYVTTNVWHVTVRGEYARFGVRADRGQPSAPGADTTYVRDGSPVMADVTGDGEKERLGKSTRVNFDVSTTVVIVVPPGKSGVGDRNGQVIEETDGWPHPGSDNSTGQDDAGSLAG